MQHERLNLSGDPAGLAQELRSLIPAPEAVAEQVTEIIARVRASGDDALRFYTREYDTGGTTPAALRVPEAELDTAEARLDDAVRDGLRLAIENVTRVAEAGLASEQTVTFDGHEVRLREVPVDSAARLRPRGPGPVPEHGDHGRGHRARRRRAEHRRVRSSRRQRRGQLGGAGRLPAGGRIGRLPDGRCAGDRRAGLRHRDGLLGGCDRRARATSTSRRPSARSSARSASTASRARRISW